ncbi:hypothetical protein THAOC_34840, partial [Thalassiosira oceanica]
LNPDPTLLLADLLGYIVTLFPAPSWTSIRPPPRVMSVEKSYTSSSAQRDDTIWTDTAAVLAPRLLTIRDRISILDRSTARSPIMGVDCRDHLLLLTRSRGAKCVLGRFGTSDWVVRDGRSAVGIGK